MNAEPGTAPNATSLPRCMHRTPTGRRCRTSIPHAGALFCLRHGALHGAIDLHDVSPALLGDLSEIDTAQDTKRVLNNLFLLLAQDRIPVKKAAVLTYILQQLLHTLPAIDRELRPLNELDSAPQITFDIPRPIRNPIPPPSTSSQDSKMDW